MSWESIPGDTRGSVTALASGPGTIVFATTAVGVYRSEDSGRTWHIAGAETGVAFGEAIAVSGIDVFAGAPDGLYRSTDGGRTWSLSLAGSRVAAVTTSGRVVLAGTDTDGVLRSEDAGRTWSGVNAGLLDLDVLALCFAAERLAFAGTPSGLYRSRNGGDSWRAVDTGLGEPAVQCLAVGAGRLVVAGTESDGLVYSEDGGTTWVQPEDFVGRSVTAVAIASDGSIAAATDSGLYVSLDRGASWQSLSGGPDAILALLDVEGAWLVGAERSGIWRLEGATWSESSTDLHASLLSSLAVGADGSLWVGGPTEGIRVWRAGRWQEFGAPTSTVLGLTVATDGRVFVAAPEGIYVATDGTWQLTYAGAVRALSGSTRIVAVAERLLVLEGETWRPLPTPFEAGGVIALAQDILAIRESSQRILWRSADGGDRWEHVPFEQVVTAVAVASDGSLWVGTTRGMYISSDAGKRFRPSDGPNRVVAIAPPYALELGGRLWRRRDSG